jgi:hypothetical protein
MATPDQLNPSPDTQPAIQEELIITPDALEAAMAYVRACKDGHRDHKREALMRGDSSAGHIAKEAAMELSGQMSGALAILGILSRPPGDAANWHEAVFGEPEQQPALARHIR